MAAKQWAVAEAKAKFSELLDEAERHGPQVILRHGKRKGIVVSPEEWDRYTKPKQNLADFLLNSPLRGSGIEFRRNPEKARRIKL